MMEGFFWKTWLVVGALAIGGASSLSHKPLTFEKAVELGVAMYNSKAGESSLYRLLEAVPPPEWNSSCESTQELNFTLKETVCLVEDELSLDECGFQEDGMVKQCTGYFFCEETPPVIVLTCVTVAGLEEEQTEEEEEKEEEKEAEEKEEEKQGEEEKEEGKDAEEKEEEKQEEETGRPRRVKRFKKFFKKAKKAVKKFVKKAVKKTVEKAKETFASHFRWW